MMPMMARRTEMRASRLCLLFAVLDFGQANFRNRALNARRSCCGPNHRHDLKKETPPGLGRVALYLLI